MKVAELTLEELEAIICRTVDEALAERDEDDEDQLELREEFIEEMDEALAAKDPGVELEEARRFIGLKS
jgi:hypothetical protein